MDGRRHFLRVVIVGAILLAHSCTPSAAGLLTQAMSPCSCFECRNYRSGCSQSVASYAHPSRNVRETGYYVGGGAALHGDCRWCDEGTWGWDYMGTVPRLIQLKWWHGRRYQGGTGSYKTDGPRLMHQH
jgi:hypothetical protein